jgi:opacity protein-like surface antigen
MLIIAAALVACAALPMVSAADCWNKGSPKGNRGAIKYAITDYCSNPSAKNWNRYYVGGGATIEISGTWQDTTQSCFGALQNIFAQCGVNGGHWDYDNQHYRVDQK